MPKAILIQSEKPKDTNVAEKDMLSFLANLPENCYVYRELKLTPNEVDHRNGVPFRKPDFVVVSQDFGVVIIETKFWNLLGNSYEWLDQYKIRKRGVDGHEDLIDNPFEQASNYRFTFRELLRDLGLNLPISSIVAFPNASRHLFLNQLTNSAALTNPQSRFLLDFETALFKEEYDQYFLKPNALLHNIAERQNGVRKPSPREVDRVNRSLIPAKFAIGDLSLRQKGREKLRILSDEQQRWVFNLDKRANYLLDVAGSGKTNALVSKAIHLIEPINGQRTPRILLTTYSETLARNIDQILTSKVGEDPRKRQQVRDHITVQSIPLLMEALLKTAYGVDNLRTPGESNRDYEARLRKEVAELLQGDDAERFRNWDYVFIDEVQDFDNLYLRICKAVCKGENFFFVGDIGQKIYERQHDMRSLGFPMQRIELQPTYKMYRTPRYIGQLAAQFVIKDPYVREEFEQNGYRQVATFASEIEYGAELLQTSDQVQSALERIQQYLSSSFTPDDVMVVAPEEYLASLGEKLSLAHIEHQRGKAGHGVSLVDFLDVKGLEGSVVLILGIESLSDRRSAHLMFVDEDQRIREEHLSRRKIYVALTRTLEHVIVFYTNADNRFIAELLDINRRIGEQRNALQKRN